MHNLSSKRQYGLRICIAERQRVCVRERERERERERGGGEKVDDNSRKYSCYLVAKTHRQQAMQDFHGVSKGKHTRHILASYPIPGIPKACVDCNKHSVQVTFKARQPKIFSC